MEIKAVEGLNFSKHAAKRSIERGITTDGQFKNVLEHAVDEARKRGLRIWRLLEARRFLL